MGGYSASIGQFLRWEEEAAEAEEGSERGSGIEEGEEEEGEYFVERNIQYKAVSIVHDFMNLYSVDSSNSKSRK